MKRNFIFALSTILSIGFNYMSIYASDSSIINQNKIYNESDYNVLIENNMIRSKNPPTGTSFVDLNHNTYNFNVEELKYKLYTNSFFQG